MPELPDVTVYVERLAERIVGKPLTAIRWGNPFVLRTALPPIAEFVGRAPAQVTRLGKRIVITFPKTYHIVIHLMIAGRLRWEAAGAKLPGRIGLAAFDFASGTLVLTEAGTTRRASVHLVHGSLAEFDRGGLETTTCTAADFIAAMTRTRHTVKRALTDPTILSGIGNAYSDEILHAAQLSPFRLTDTFTPDEWQRLLAAIRQVLATWTDRLRAQPGFPTHVTAFRDGMAVHGRFGQPCPRCGRAVQRIVYGKHEANYCAKCQTGGKLLADRALSRLLRSDWPRTLDELEERRAVAKPKS